VSPKVPEVSLQTRRLFDYLLGGIFRRDEVCVDRQARPWHRSHAAGKFVTKIV
jgi:hypothetical protein